MTEIKRIVIHCAATPHGKDIGAAEIDAMHKARGFQRQARWTGALRHIGYSHVIRIDGRIELGRCPDYGEELAHAASYNRNAIAICLIGGLDDKGRPSTEFAPAQFKALRDTLTYYARVYPAAEIMGHRDLPAVAKDCPCFDVAEWLQTGVAKHARKK